MTLPREPDGTIISPDTSREQRVPPGQHLARNFPVLHEGPVHRIPEKDFRLRVWGLVERELDLDWTALLTLGVVKVHSDIHCVTTWSRLDHRWEGIQALSIARAAGVLSSAGAVMVHCVGGYTTNLLLEDFMEEDVILAIRDGREPISAEHGGPARLIVPRLYLWKSAKWPSGIEFIDRDRPGFWEQRGYHIRGDPWKEERYS